MDRMRNPYHSPKLWSQHRPRLRWFYIGIRNRIQSLNIIDLGWARCRNLCLKLISPKRQCIRERAWEGLAISWFKDLRQRLPLWLLRVWNDLMDTGKNSIRRQRCSKALTPYIKIMELGYLIFRIPKLKPIALGLELPKRMSDTIMSYLQELANLRLQAESGESRPGNIW